MSILAGQSALVTGAGQGIGRGIALCFAKAGAVVGVLDLDAAKCSDVASEVVRLGGSAMALPADITNSTSVNQAVFQFSERPAEVPHHCCVSVLTESNVSPESAFLMWLIQL